MSKPIVGSATRDLVPTGARHVAACRKSNIRTVASEKPSTSRALVLRNGKHGARGTGELMILTKLSGREKLDLLAEDLVQRSKNAVMSPFRLEQCLKIAESQRNAYLDEILSLRDPQLFMELIQAELIARIPTNDATPEPLKNPSSLASVVATRVHNTYMLASAWKIVFEMLYELVELDLTDGNIKSQLKASADIRNRYLVLYDLVDILVNVTHAKFSVLATISPHYARYFKKTESIETDSKEHQFVFDWTGLREACVSFLDSIIIELCFPRAPYPKMILFQVLRDAVDESPKEATRFPQILWDVIGDLSIAVELQQLLEAPLLSSQCQSWVDTPRKMPMTYEDWVDAQLYSERACNKSEGFSDIIFPLEKTKSQDVLDNMWKCINLNYEMVSGSNIDSLWSLTDVLEASPQWYNFRTLNFGHSPDPVSNLRVFKSTNQQLVIKSHAANDTYDSMPELRSGSNSSDQDDRDDGNDDDNDTLGHNVPVTESEYDMDQEDEFREMLKEVTDIVNEADWLGAEGDVEAFTRDDRKSNPFLKLLGSLRGRMFSANPRLKTVTRIEPLHSRLARPIAQPIFATTRSPAASELKSNFQESSALKCPTEEARVPATKKKKKKSQRKKPLPHNSQAGPRPLSPSTAAPATSATPSAIPQKPTIAKVATLKTSKILSSTSFDASSSLPISSELNAQSSRSYLQAENLDTLKIKVKSRPNHATTFSAPGEKKMISGFAKVMGREKAEVEESPKNAKQSWFAKLGKKSRELMHQLLNTAESDKKGIAPMKWESFLKVMREMGFDCDITTAGSSVRFDPRDKRIAPITIHKPHPDPTLQPITLKRIAKRLKNRYGWDASDMRQE